MGDGCDHSDSVNQCLSITVCVATLFCAAHACLLFTISEADIWLNDPAVRTALHAAPKAMTGPWQLCSNRIHYRSDGGSMLPVHNKLVREWGECVMGQSKYMHACWLDQTLWCGRKWRCAWTWLIHSLVMGHARFPCCRRLFWQQPFLQKRTHCAAFWSISC